MKPPNDVKIDLFNLVDLDEVPTAEELGLPAGIEIVNIREGGLIDCWIPVEYIDSEEVPVRREWADELAQQMRELAAEEGGTGQHQAITVGMIAGEDKLKIMDGFHREAALEINGETRIYSTVKNVDWDRLYDYRILTTKEHSQVQFSRVVQWIREVWQYSGLADEMTVEQAVLLFRFDTDGSKLGLETDSVSTAKAWVARKEHQWGMKAMTIHSHLKVAEHVAPDIVHAVRTKGRGDKLEAPTPQMVNVFADVIPDREDLQYLVRDVAMYRNLKGPEIKALCTAVKDCGGFDEAFQIVDEIDWVSWEPEYGETKKRSLRKAHDPRQKGTGVFDKTGKEIDGIRQRMEQSVDRDEPIDDEHRTNIIEARRRAIDLSNALAQLAVDMSIMIDEKPPLVAFTSNDTLEEESTESFVAETPQNALPADQVVDVVEKRMGSEESVDVDDESESFEAETFDAEDDEKEKIILESDADDDSVEDDPSADVLWDDVSFQDDIEDEDEELEIVPSIIKPVSKPSSARNRPINEARKPTYNSRFQRDLKAFLDGMNGTVIPEITTRPQIRQAEDMLLHGSFAGDPNLLDDLRDELEFARKAL